MDAFDADVLIHAVEAGHPSGRRIRALFVDSPDGEPVGVGSVLLLPEVLSRPIREQNTDELDRLGALLARIELRPVDRAAADLATSLGAKYRLRAADAVHLATAVLGGADRFVTNNRRDFSTNIEEIEIVYPEGLPDPDFEDDAASGGTQRRVEAVEE
ncbi:MAG: type II toxin-antitoxin system VapC family toxin [Sporichthyaceae bacterium]